MKSLTNLNKLAEINQLKIEPKNQTELDSLIESGTLRLKDANNSTLALESRFDLAYNAAHSLSLAALRWHGYRPSNRFVVFQAIPHTLELGPEVWRVLVDCHNRRNQSEYEGVFEISDLLLSDLLKAVNLLLSEVQSLLKED